jgi:hypothetical protein
MAVQCWAPKELKSDYTWRDGIDLMASFMRPVDVSVDKWGAPISRPRYFVAWGCKDHIRELNNYRSKEPVKGQNVPEFGNKVEDHTIDAMRYALLCLYKLGAAHHLTKDMVSAAPVELSPRAVAERRAAENNSAWSQLVNASSSSGGIFTQGEEGPVF